MVAADREYGFLVGKLGRHIAEWEAPEPPSDLVFDDGELLETNRHRIAMNVLTNQKFVLHSSGGLLLEGQAQPSLQR